jgi:mono/diheme cytochrome c family protein
MRVRTTNRSQVTIGACLLGMMLLARVAQAAHDTTPEREAWYLVKQRCYLCHFIDQQDERWGRKWGPSLKGLFQRQDAKLINGKPINEQTVAEWINEGSANMPAFKYTLNARQVQLIITYLKGGFPNAPRQDGTYAQAAQK